MRIRSAFGRALRQIRQTKHLAQEDFDNVSRTYVSTLERGLKSPTLDMIEELSASLGVHPLTLLTLAYTKSSGSKEIRTLQDRIADELEQVRQAAKEE